MIKLLISVTCIEEAQIALESGADIIDLKDPAEGALGALPLERIKSIVNYVNRQKLISATIGDLPLQSEQIISEVNKLKAAKVDYIKIGFFDVVNYQQCLLALKKVSEEGVKLIAVIFAENTYPEGFIKSINEAGFMGVMLDTAKKDGLTLLHYYTDEQRKKLINEVFHFDMTFGMAGSLNIRHVEELKILQPTYMGFRGGVCDENNRELKLDAMKIKEIRNII